MKPKLKAAIYVRVSTSDQQYDMQLTDLRDYVARMGWELTEYAEKGSSMKIRPVLNQLMADAKLRKFDVIAVWKIDRFARSLAQLIANLQQLDTWGIRFVSLTDSIDTDKRNPASRLLMQILGSVAEFERSMIVERTTAGRRQYDADYKAGRIGKDKHSRSGKNLPSHRPKKIFRRDLAREMRAAGKSLRAIAKELDVPLTTIVRALKSGS